MTQNKNEICISEDESKICLLDGKKFESNRKMIWYVRKTYNLNFEEYVIKAYYNNIRPTCLKTGNRLSFKPNKLGPWFSNYSKNNFPRNKHSEESKEKIKIGCEKTFINRYGVSNVFSTDWCKKKIKDTLQSKYGVSNIMHIDAIKKKVFDSFLHTLKTRQYKPYSGNQQDPNRPSQLEIDLQNKLKELKIEFISPFIYEGKRYDFFIPQINAIIELDGEAFHKDNLENLTLVTINNSVNDYNKNNIIKNSKYEFYRIRYDSEQFNIDENDNLLSNIKNMSYIPNYKLSYYQKIITKEYFKRYIELKGKDKLKKYSHHLLKFIRTFQPSFPYPELKETIDNINNTIYSNIHKIYDISTNEFSNNISSVGNNYLKHYFKSYWKSKFNKNKSPEESWQDDHILKKVIEYRIGCNDSDEIFDFSLHQLIRGLSARRISISFFKPILAAAIYKHYLRDIQHPIVLDPCCGFGGRLLGFKSIYPNGTYIGCEPNIETYNELIELKERNKWENVEIYNCKFEDFNKLYDYNLIFTSIPYFDLEIYSNNTTYESFEHWKNTFIHSLEKYKNFNCYINVPIQLANKLNWNNIDSTIISNSSHFNKCNDKKIEYIIKL